MVSMVDAWNSHRLLMLLLLPLGLSVAQTTTIAATDGLIDWAGRLERRTKHVAFDWEGVNARLRVENATFVRLTVSTTAATRGTRLKAYASDQGFLMYPQVQFWVDHASPTNTLWLSNVPASTVVTLENLIDPQYDTGITTVESFSTDGSFVALAPADRLGGADRRRIEFVGDSITAATNIVRPEGATAFCGDAGYQSDWSQTYEALLCHRFGAACSTMAVGGKCVMHECGGLQMPDYYPSTFYADNKPTASFDFSSEANQPDAIFIDLGTNDLAYAIPKLPPEVGMARFANETFEFMRNASRLYGKDDIQFFLSAGPMENATAPGTLKALELAKRAGMKATFVDMRPACATSRLHQKDNQNLCDGCARHPGIEAHRGMYELAWPIIADVMGWDSWPPSANYTSL